MSGVSRFAPFPVSSVAPAGFYHTPPPHPLSLPGFVLLAAYPHHRRHLFKRAVFASSFDAHTVIAPPRRTPGKTPSAAHASGHHIRAIIQRPAPRQAGRGERRNEGMACGPARCLAYRASLSRCPVLPSCPSPFRRIPSAGAFHPGEATIHGEVIYSAPFSSAHLIRPTPRRSIRASKQASKQGKTAGGYRRFSVPSSYPRPDPSSPRLASRVGGRGGFSPVSPHRLVHSDRGTKRGSAVSGSSSLIAFHEEGGRGLSPFPRLFSVLAYSSMMV